ncbi:MAG: HAMP domain-containing histidine kinase [Clostridia bacterium]|nr:HAMP domain-containing histidine kinase [Clostridia bacterium]
MKKKSFVRECAIQSMVSLIVIFVIFILIYSFANDTLEMSFPTISELLDYEDRLLNDEFEKIPLGKFKTSKILIYDEEYKVLFASDKNIENQIKESDIEYINNYLQGEHYEVYNFMKKNKTKVYYIMKIKNEENGERLEDYAIVSYELKVLEGTLFGEKTELTEFEFNLISDNYEEDYGIEKYEYETVNGEKRILVFINPIFSSENYGRALTRVDNIYIIAIPLVIAVIIIESLLYRKRLRKSIEPLDTIINYYENNKDIIENIDEEIAVEFRPTAKRFKDLLEKIEKTNLEKNKIIANISHDLKTPMTAIMGYAQAFKDNIVPEDKMIQYIDSIYDKAALSTDLVDRLVEYTKLEHPEYRIKLVEKDINKFSKQYMENKEHEITSKGFILKLEILDEECKCMIDTELIVRLYDNLISNTLKYNKSGTNILFRIEKIETQIKIIIADNGIGISKEIRDSIFEPFVTTNEARTSGEGSGLGMAIAKNIMKLHKGSIVLNDKPENGYVTEFDIYLPEK